MKPSWDENTVHVQALILAFDQTCEHDENEMNSAMLKAGVPRFSKRR